MATLKKQKKALEDEMEEREEAIRKHRTDKGSALDEIASLKEAMEAQQESLADVDV